MTAEIETPEVVDDETPSTALDAAITAALDGGEAAEAPASARERAENGQFKSKQAEEGGKDAVAEAPAAETAAPVDATPATTAPVSAPKWTDGHFTGWKPEQRERFAALPPDVQQLVMERQTESQAFYQRKLGEEGEFRKHVEPLARAAQEVEPFARSIGVAPHDLLKSYAAIDQKLRYAPFAEKVQLLGQIAKEYGVPFAAPEQDPYADPLQPNGQAYPVIHDLQSRVQYLQAQLGQYQQQHEAQTQQQFSSQIEAFSSAKAPDGTPAHPYFDTVRPAMGQLLAEGKARSLDEAYAIATKPLIERIAAEVEARQKAAAAAQAQSVARAKKAAPIRSSAIAPGGKTTGGGIDRVLDSTLAQYGIN